MDYEAIEKAIIKDLENQEISSPVFFTLLVEDPAFDKYDQWWYKCLAYVYQGKVHWYTKNNDKL